MAGSQTDIRDQSGTTVHASFTATTTPTNFPSSPGNLISDVIIVTPEDDLVEISFDGGTNYFPICCSFAWAPKQVAQIKVKTSSATAAVYILANLEDY